MTPQASTGSTLALCCGMLKQPPEDFYILLLGYVIRGPSPSLPSWWPVLLPVSSGIIRLGAGGPCPCGRVHCVHAGLLCILFQNMDRSFRFFCQRCESKSTFLLERWAAAGLQGASLATTVYVVVCDMSSPFYSWTTPLVGQCGSPEGNRWALTELALTT